MRAFVRGILLWGIRNLDSLLVLLVAATCAVLHLVHIIDLEIVAGVTLAVLALVGFSILHDRVGRATLESTLGKLSDKLASLSANLKAPNADAFFTTSSSERPLLETAEQEVWAVQETGSLLVESNKNELIALLKQGRRFRMVVCSPIEATARLMALRNANLAFDAILNRAKLLESHIRDVITQSGASAQGLEVRFVPYPIDMTCVIIDPRHPSPAKRRGIVRHAGFQVTYADKLDFGFSAATSPAIFSHYSKEARRVFDHAAKIVLLTGPPRCGKTQLLEKMVERLQGAPELSYAVSPSIGERNKRLGFGVRVCGSAELVTFASRATGEDEYRLVPDVWPGIIKALQLARENGKIIILDEIGGLQLREASFVNFVESAVADICATLFASIASDDNLHPLIGQLKRHHRTTVLELSKNNAEEIEAILVTELDASLRLARAMPRRYWGANPCVTS